MNNEEPLKDEMVKDEAVKEEIAKDDPLKQELGGRFRKFRKAIGKTQYQIAEELGVYQSSVTNIEIGKTFPKINYLRHFYEKYDLNLTWLFLGYGPMFVNKEELANEIATEPLLPVESPRRESYREMITMMRRSPTVEYVILAKMVELKALMRENLEEVDEKSQVNLIRPTM